MNNAPISACHPKTTAHIISTTETSAEITLFGGIEKNNSCVNCEKNNGCQSFSLSHWLLNKQTITIAQPTTNDQNHYQAGDELGLHFPTNLLRNSLLLLIGIPFIGFLCGVCISSTTNEITGFMSALLLAFIGYLVAHKISTGLLSKQIIIDHPKQHRQK